MRTLIKILSICILLFLTSCGSQPLDKLTLLLTIGVDIEDGKVVFYTASPVFNQEAKDEVEILRIEARSVRESRTKLNVLTHGTALGGKLQNFIVSKRVLQKYGMYALTDVFYRDPKAAINANMIMYNGDIKELLYLKPKDTPRLSLYIRSVVDTAKENEQAIKTTLQQFHREMLERGITPSVTEMAVRDKKAFVAGSALLDEDSKYVTSLNNKESSLLLLLQKNASQPVLLTTAVSGSQHPAKQFTFSLEYVKEKIKTYYDTKQKRFRFDMSFKMKVVISESNGFSNFEKQQREAEKRIAAYMKKELEKTVQKVQKKKIDPIGFGLYARAYQYKHWKKVQDHWGEAFAKADVHIQPDVQIISFGMRR